MYDKCMPFLPFEAVDATGKTIRGTLQANSVQDLEMILLQKGLRMVNHGMQRANPAPAPTPQRPMQVARPVPAVQPARPVQRPISVTERPSVRPQADQPSTASKTDTIRTPELSYKEKYFLFAQFSSFIKAGFSASQMIQHTTSKAPPKLRQMFAEMETEVANGMALSDSMARRPITFGPDIVATVKAGEQSGHMGESFDVLVNQLERAKAFNRSLYYFYIMAPMLILCGVGGIGLQKASQLTIRRQFDADGQLSQVGTLVEEVRKQLPHDFLNAVLIAAAFVLAIKLFHKYPFRMIRHRLGIWMPLGYSRARSEAVERFSWSMSTMLKGGASPASAVLTAASSIPNLVLRQNALDSLGSGSRENEPLGSVLQRTGLMSPEYVHIAQNGELVGDTPGALNSIMNAEGAQVQTKSAGLNTVIVALTTIAMAIFTVFMLAFLYKMYASGLIKLMLEQ